MSRAAEREEERRPSGRRRWWLVLPVGVAVLLVAGALVLTVFSDALAGLLGLPLAPDRSLEAEVGRAFGDSQPDEVVDLAELVDGPWDRVGVFGPYLPHERVRDAISVDVSTGVTNNLTYDDRCLLVFAGDGRVVAWTTVSRGLVDCTGALSGQVYARDQALFAGDRLGPADRVPAG